MTTIDEALAEAEQFERIGREFAEYAAQANQAWRDCWPAHCPVCAGWGGTPLNQGHLHDASGSNMVVWKRCEALEPSRCHRCGEAGLDENGAGPCTRVDGITTTGCE